MLQYPIKCFFEKAEKMDSVLQHVKGICTTICTVSIEAWLTTREK